LERHSLLNDGWLDGTSVIHSPNFDARPIGIVPDLIVLHAISLPPRQFGTDLVERLFTNRLEQGLTPYTDDLLEARVSAHFFIDRLGEVTQFVSVTSRAWHAGVSAWEGRSACNDFSIGIELEGCDDLPFDGRQYISSALLIDNLVKNIPTCSWSSLVGHSDIAPLRKTDPGPYFSWEKLEREHSRLS
jgi:N-acetyl-anhydromuramoyl-L-alanine amidase